MMAVKEIGFGVYGIAMIVCVHRWTAWRRHA